MTDSWWRLQADAWRFRRARSDYYAYLAALLRAGQGHFSLRDIFANDARRYGPGHYRGRLAARWEQACGTHGGELAALWVGVAPAQECLLLATAQGAGAQALVQGLEDLARACRLSEQAMQQLWGTLASAIAAVTVLLGTLWAIPLFTAPHLKQVFGHLPAAYFGPLTLRLYALAANLMWLGPLVALVAMACFGVGVWSLGHWSGPWRVRCDGIGPWRLYRDAQAIRFLGLLEVLLRDRGAIDTRLRAALQAQRHYALPWLGWHIDMMLARIDQGVVGAATFQTGLLDRELWWFMSDMMAAHGIEMGLTQARQRVEQRWLPRLLRQAAGWRWLLLILTVLAMLGLAFWHYGVIDELRRGLTSFYAAA